MIGRDHSDVFVAACGEVLPTRYSGVEHEKNCRRCLGMAAVQQEGKSEEEGFRVINLTQYEQRYDLKHDLERVEVEVQRFTNLPTDVPEELRSRLLYLRRAIAAERKLELYEPACRESGDLFCWCVEHLSKFPPMNGKWIDDVKTRLAEIEAAK